jgi:UDP-3-O-[3-hydroxymyristoyl] glucosamine N-acyltransferase
VQIGANSVIGSPGFIPFGVVHARCLPCFGSVHIDEGVRIGALCTIDRGFLGVTRIGSNTLIDNMVHVGHDVDIGAGVIIAAQTGIAGFVRIGDRATLGGQVGIKPHATVGTGARVSGKSLVHCDIENDAIWSGNPSLPHAQYLRAYGQLKRSFKDRSR